MSGPVASLTDITGDQLESHGGVTCAIVLSTWVRTPYREDSDLFLEKKYSIKLHVCQCKRTHQVHCVTDGCY
jgi:hypothetical protein